MPAAISYRERLQVVLVRPRNRLNIGARAMSNFGVRHLSLVNPYGVAFREVPSAVGAAAVLTDSFFDLVARGDTWSERREMRRHEMDDDEREMARRCFGYGCWNAPYWFIGQEQGMAHEENDDLRIRLEAWRHFDSRELDDACAFHLRIGETRWCGQHPQLQSTWKKLIRTLLTFPEKPVDKASVLAYQKHNWGRQPGETCVIEISGLAANNLDVERDRECYQAERIKDIRDRMTCYQPKFIIMYGTTDQRPWKAIAESAEVIPESTLRITIGSVGIRFCS